LSAICVVSLPLWKMWVRSSKLTVQRVPRHIYPATYPCWFFDRERLLAHFAPDFELVSEHANEDGAGSGLTFGGFLFARRHGTVPPVK